MFTISPTWFKNVNFCLANLRACLKQVAHFFYLKDTPKVYVDFYTNWYGILFLCLLDLAACCSLSQSDWHKHAPGHRSLTPPHKLSGSIKQQTDQRCLLLLCCYSFGYNPLSLLDHSIIIIIITIIMRFTILCLLSGLASGFVTVPNAKEVRKDHGYLCAVVFLSVLSVLHVGCMVAFSLAQELHGA